MTSIYIDFHIKSEKINVNLDSILGVKGKSHKINDISKTGIKLSYSEWNYCFDEKMTNEVNEVADQLFVDIESKIGELQKYIHNSECLVSIYFVIRNYEKNEDYIYYDLSRDNIINFSKINAEILFDGVS